MTDNKKAIAATFHTARPVPSRGVVSFVFDVPAEQATAALELLGGFPSGGESVWVGIVPLAAKPEERKPDAKTRYAESDEATQAVARAGILANDRAFHRWCRADGKNAAADYIRATCGIVSRSDIASRPEALAKFLALESRFRTETRFGPQATR